MTFLHIGFLLPFFALFELLPIAGGLSLDEIIVLSFLPFSIFLTPWRALSPVLVMLLVVATLCILNLSVFFHTTNFLLQMLNVLAYFSFFVFALSRIRFSIERTLSIYFSVLTFYLVAGYLLVVVYFVSPAAYVAFVNTIGQANTAGTGIIGIRYFSLFHEPSHFIQFASFGYMYLFIAWLTRAHPVSLLYLAVLGISLILTRSALALVPLLAPMIVLMMRYMFTSKGLLVLATAIILVVVELTLGIIPEAVTERFEDLVAGLLKQGSLAGINASSGSLVNNIFVALKTVQNTYGAGIGFGSYKVAFDLYSNQNAGINLYNSVSGGSLLIRILTEFGIIGVILFLSYITLKLRVRRTVNPLYYCFSWACLAVILTSFARLGGYTTGLFPFAFIGYFFGLYLFTYKSYTRVN